MKPLIVPRWPVPVWVRACSTLRGGAGSGAGPYGSFNLAAHVGDDPAAVGRNREDLRRIARLPNEPLWLSQVHGCRVVEADRSAAGCEADGAWTAHPGTVCAVMTADCLPVLLCHRERRRVAAVHAGWRGLARGVLPAAIAALGGDPAGLVAWLGPAIGPRVYEVGPEVRAELLRQEPGGAAAMRPSDGRRWLLDLYALARLQLAQRGVDSVHGGEWCTFTESERFFSFRRERVTGRMATLIWIAGPAD